MRRPRIEIGGGFLLLLALLLLTEERLTGPFLMACAVHEAGHLLMLYALGGRAERIRCTVCGAEISVAALPGISYPAEMLSVLAGPMAGLILSLAAAKLGFCVTAGVSLVLTVFNLLPLRGQDGGRLLYLLLAWRGSPVTARQVAAVISRSVSLLFLLLGLWVLYRGGGIALLAAALWILACHFPTRGIK